MTKTPKRKNGEVRVKLGLSDACFFSVYILGKSRRTVTSIPSY